MIADVVAAIIERDGKILLFSAQIMRGSETGFGEFAGGKSEPSEASRRRLSRATRES